MKNVYMVTVFLTMAMLSIAGAQEAPEGFVLIAPGSFVMGSPDESLPNESQHTVHITRGFYMQATEVTQAEYELVMGENPSAFKESRLPVEMVSWYDAVRYCNKRSEKEGLQPCYRINETEVSCDWNANGYRLPTESEWEYACRAGTTERFFTGNCLSADDANYNGKNPLSGCDKGKYRGKTWPAGSGKANAWGLYDMSGNVWEWCWDRYGDYPAGSVSDPTGADSGSDHLLRGGCWARGAKNCRSAA
ncbi:MAG TPA: formylglycine-generating enzyme family protein, partial [bacterium]|nr:formylglycine-generating enzyme family protein [bacterium]